MTTAEQIRALRASTGMTQAAFSAQYEIPKRTLQDWERGLRTPPPYVVTMLSSLVSLHEK